MKRCICIFLCLTVFLSLLAGCGSGKVVEPEGAAVTEAVSVETTAPLQEEAPEVLLLLEQDWVPESIKQDLDETIRWNEMLDMLGGVISQCDGDQLEQWNGIINPTEAQMQRDDGMLAIYEAACVLGIGKYAWNNRDEVKNHYTVHIQHSMGYEPDSAAFTNVREFAPYEDFPGRVTVLDYATCAKYFSMSQSSLANPEPFFEHCDADTRFDHPLTRREAIEAAEKLKLAYEVMHSGGYTIPETDWEDPLLADARAARDAILNSPTTITKADDLILGETYTGNAYYVSNSGNDGNDGLSPETAWATMEKVEKARLNYGDAVFFERGGTWYGSLKMQYGVTYSAYGEGAKPMITGSPQDAASEEKWELFSETADGGKIWKYTEEMPDAGVILLNGSEVVARKAYPLWNEREYTNAEGETYVIEEELEDLMFFSSLNLRGVRLGTIIEGDGRTGPLYLRCDAGNPGQVFDKIEFSVISSGTMTADKGWNAVDNLHFHCYATSGMDCNNHSNIVYQNCETDWCGGAVKNYQENRYDPNDLMALVSGGGMLLFGTDITCKNNYIHDCESKGLAVVVNGMDGNPAWLQRFNILAEGNVVERCGNGVLLWVDSAVKDKALTFENIRFTGNFFVNGSYGWRQMNTRDLVDNHTHTISAENVLATGEVLFEDNLFYRGAGTLINCDGDDLQKGAVMPTMQGNVYVQDKGQLLFVKRDNAFGYYSGTTLATSDQDLMETCVREYIGDTTGEVIILE